MKHIVASGCSFTRQERRINLEGDDTNFLKDWIEMWRWPHWIQKEYNTSVYNMGSATHDNWSIARTTIYKIELEPIQYSYDKLKNYDTKSIDKMLSSINSQYNHISSPLSNEEFIVPLTINEKTSDKFTFTPKRRHRKYKKFK